ncbi:hypothetical protein [Microbacterium sp. JZ101]
MTTSDDAAVEPPFLVEARVREEIARTLASAAPDDWEAIRYRAATVAGVADVTISLVREGREEPFLDAPSVALPRRRLRAAMYRPGEGTWFSLELEVSRSGSVEARYDYDGEPAFHVAPAASAWAQDQERFPRDPENQPDWLKRKLEEASS